MAVMEAAPVMVAEPTTDQQPTESICRHCGQAIWRTAYGPWMLDYSTDAPGFCWGGPPAKHSPITPAEMVLVP